MDTPPPEPSITLVPSLQRIVDQTGLDPAKLTIAVRTEDKQRIQLTDRHTICVSDGKKVTAWIVGSLTELFRGQQVPPADLPHYPVEYVPYFFFLEKHFLLLCDIIGDRTDQEMEEVYAALRRRPDGRTTGTAHDFMWQVSALLLGQYVLSSAQFEGLMDALLRSARKWAMRAVSRFYAAYLRTELARVGE